MNARVANMVSELRPVDGAAMLSGTSFTAAQLNARATHFFISAEAETKMTVDGTNPAGGGVVHTLGAGGTMTLRRSALLAAKWSVAVSISQWEIG